jgi:NAD(P)H-dependent flavin oxidoreductase YrpB (nitropropane dioxygenase family)
VASHRDLKARLDIDLPVLAAPMAGGPGNVALVTAAAAAGSLGFLAAGYKTADAVAAEVAAVRELTDCFGVNVFAPNPLPLDPTSFRRYAKEIATDAQTYDLDLSAVVPTEDDDHWQDKLDLLIGDPVPVVSFTFAIPGRDVIAALQRAGTTVVQTVTTAAEARRAASAGCDALVVQASVAGGHSGIFDPGRPLSTLSTPELVASVVAAVDLPVLAAGGISTSEEVTQAVSAGAMAVVVGTALLRTPECGTSAVHRAALVDPTRESVITRAFTGRPARGLRNGFIVRHEAQAPVGYPALHHLTSPMRRAATAAGDPERVNLWAGVGHRAASGDATAVVLQRLGSGR